MQLLQYSLNPHPQLLQLIRPTAPARPLQTRTALPIPSSSSCSKLSRRAGLVLTGSSSLPLLLLLASNLCSRTQEARAAPDSSTSTANDDCNNQLQTIITTKKAFLDVSIDGEPAGRITVGLYGGSTPFGSSRFASLVSGSAGISYRRKEFAKIMPGYIQHVGVRSYGADAELIAARTGSSSGLAGGGGADADLVAEWEAASRRCPGSTKNVAGAVGIVVRDPAKPPPKVKVVARRGRLEIDEEEVGKDPNGTEFVIATKDSPELDASTLVVGRVLDGMDVAEKISKVRTVQDNTGSPYFRVAKLIGDKRAVVAERGFNRPYSKVVITNCGLID